MLVLLGRLRLLRPRSILGEQTLPLAWLSSRRSSALHGRLLLELLRRLLGRTLVLLRGLLWRLLLHHARIPLHPRIATLL